MSYPDDSDWQKTFEAAIVETDTEKLICAAEAVEAKPPIAE
jgi:hypothetical protein